MPAYRFPTLVWQDAGGFHTARPIEAADESWVGFGTSATKALEQLRDYLTWLHRRETNLPEPDLLDAVLSSIKVTVRPEYQARKRVYPCSEVVLPVHCVAGRT